MSFNSILFIYIHTDDRYKRRMTYASLAWGSKQVVQTMPPNKDAKEEQFCVEKRRCA